jgi:outer membrane lipoprotein-sorting protein
MRERILILSIFFMAGACVFAKEACCKPLSASQIMEKVASRGSALESFTSEITYSLTEEPDIFEITTTYTGFFKYLETDERQYAMIDFRTRQEDELPAEDYHQLFVFDGVWLSRIDHRLKQVNRDQLAREDEPEDVFKLISEDFPLMGFSGADKLLQKYDAVLEETDKKDVYVISLEPKEDSDAKYSDIRFVIDGKSLLPLEVRAKSLTDNSICNIELTDRKINAGVDEDVFKFDIPKDYTVSVKKLDDGSDEN